MYFFKSKFLNHSQLPRIPLLFCTLSRATYQIFSFYITTQKDLSDSCSFNWSSRL